MNSTGDEKPQFEVSFRGHLPSAAFLATTLSALLALGVIAAPGFWPCFLVLFALAALAPLKAWAGPGYRARAYRAPRRHASRAHLFEVKQGHAARVRRVSDNVGSDAPTMSGTLAKVPRPAPWSW
jgi:hypothetical protein